MESAKICSNCKVQPANNGHAWCRQCRSAHEAKRQATQAEMMMARNWQAGAQAIRIAMADQLRRAPDALYAGRTIAQWIAEFPAPDFPRAVNPDTDNRENG